MTVSGAGQRRAKGLTTVVSLALAFILQLTAGLLLVRMCREEVLARQTPEPLIMVYLAPEPAPAGPVKTAAPASVEDTEKVSHVPEISQPALPVEEPRPVLPQPLPEPIPEPEKAPPESEAARLSEAVPIEPLALQKTEKLKKFEPPKKHRISKKNELKPVKPSKKTANKPVSELLEKPAAQPELRPESQSKSEFETVKQIKSLGLPLPEQMPTPALPESTLLALSSSAQTDENALSQTEKTVKALSGEEQKAIARYLAQIRKSLDRSRVYPPEARKKRIEGVVPVRFRISEDGLVVGAEISGSAPGILAEAAIQMLAGRRFPPPPTGWQPSAAIELNINFNLR